MWADLGLAGFPRTCRLTPHSAFPTLRSVTRVHPVTRSVRVHGSRAPPEFAEPRPTGTILTRTGPRTPLEFGLRTSFSGLPSLPAHGTFSARTVPASAESRTGTFPTPFADSRSGTFPGGFPRQGSGSRRGVCVTNIRSAGCRRGIRQVAGLRRHATGAFALRTVLAAFGVDLVELLLGDIPIPVHIQIGEFQAWASRAAGLLRGSAVGGGLGDTTDSQQRGTGEDRGDDEFDIHGCPLFRGEVRRLAPGAPTAVFDSVDVCQFWPVPGRSCCPKGSHSHVNGVCGRTHKIVKPM